MSREVMLLVDDIVTAFRDICAWMEPVDPERFRQDGMLRSAIERALTIAGEAAKHVPDSVKARRPHIDWRGLARLRDLLSHLYFQVDVDELWQIAATKVPADLPDLTSLLAELELERFGPHG